METCVLIPQEFSLCIRNNNNNSTSNNNNNNNNNKELEVSVWSNSAIAQGALCYPFQGTIRLDKLDVYGHLDDEDVSYQ